MKRLARLRAKRALTLRELSEMSGVSVDTINRIELGQRKPRPSTTRKLARALDVTPEELLREEAEEELLEKEAESAAISGALWRWGKLGPRKEAASPRSSLRASGEQRRLTAEPSAEVRVHRILEKVTFAVRRDHFKRLDIERWERGDVPAPDYPYIKSLDMEAADKAFIQNLVAEGIWEVYNDVIHRRGGEASEEVRDACLRLGETLLRMAHVTDRARTVALRVRAGFSADFDRDQKDLEEWLRSTLEEEWLRSTLEEELP